MFDSCVLTTCRQPGTHTASLDGEGSAIVCDGHTPELVRNGYAVQPLPRDDENGR